MFRLPSRAVRRTFPTEQRAVLRAIAAISAGALALSGCGTSAVRAQSSVPSFGVARSSRSSAQRTNTRILAATATTSTTSVQATTLAAASTTVEPAGASAQSSDRAGSTDFEERTVPVQGVDVQAGISVAEVSAPFSVVSAALQDFASYRLFLPRLNESRVVRRRRGESEVYLRAELLEGLGAVWSLQRFRVTRANGSIVVEGERIDGTMRRFDVRIEAVEVSGTNRTRIAVRLLGLPPFPLPSSYLTRMHGRWTARALRALAGRVEGLAASQPRRP